MDKDQQIQGLKKITNYKLIPTPDLPPRIKTSTNHNNGVVYKRIAEPTLSASGSHKQFRPASLHGSGLR